MRTKNIFILVALTTAIPFVAVSISTNSLILAEVKKCFNNIESGFSDTIGEMSTDDPYLIFKRTEDLVLTCLEGKK